MPYKGDQPPMRGFAINNIPGFWLKNGEVAKDLYVAFTAKSADAVRASYKAAIDAGATLNKEPSLRPEWRADYFAANIGDPDGYNIEIAYKPRVRSRGACARSVPASGLRVAADRQPPPCGGVAARRRKTLRAATTAANHATCAATS